MKNFISQSISKLKNAQLSKKTIVNLKRKKQLETLLRVIWSEGLILGFKINSTNIKVFLKYNKTKPCINSLKLVSKSNHKIYLTIKKVWKLSTAYSCLIFSTNKGLKSIKECKRQNLGGELFLAIKWTI